MRRLLPALAALATALFAAPAALAATYDVLGTGDGSGSCTQIFPSAFQCPTLRAAVDASNASPDEDDGIIVHAGTYVLSAGHAVDHRQRHHPRRRDRAHDRHPGQRERRGSSRSPARRRPACRASRSRAAGSRAATAATSRSAPGATLSMILSRVTDGQASNGGGIANQGQLTIFNSLVDGNVAGNAGGGIYNDGVVRRRHRERHQLDDRGQPGARVRRRDRVAGQHRQRRHADLRHGRAQHLERRRDPARRAADQRGAVLDHRLQRRGQLQRHLVRHLAVQPRGRHLMRVRSRQ